ncbi:MAG: nitronate monooxygenase [Planctomycetota bacterium]
MTHGIPAADALPRLIQGGMGVAVSGWRLARTVSRLGQLGVVSGTALDLVLVRRLQLGDEGGHVRRALAAFPVAGVAEGLLDRYFVEGGKAESARFRAKPMPSHRPSRELLDLLVAGNFVECWLAKEKHDGLVGINYLDKIQVPTVPSIYGAMLAGVDVLLVGAGIPKAIPPVLDALAAGRSVETLLDVRSASPREDPLLHFDPVEYCDGAALEARRPLFLPIVSSHVLAVLLARKLALRVDGFVVEAPTAGGHNAPARNRGERNARGEPVYGERDRPDLAIFRELGRPFWLAGSYGTPAQVQNAVADGARGVQVGTAFAYCAESGLSDALKARVLEASRRRQVSVFTDPVASPTGFPFTVVELEGTLSEEGSYRERTRVCDLGYLRSAYVDVRGGTAWRCAAEPVEDYVRKGGAVEDTVGRKCLCNALMSNVGLGQVARGGRTENVLVTSGDDVATVARFLAPGATSYTAKCVVDRLLGDCL